MKNSVVLHCDTGGRPYRAEDFVPPLNQVGVLQDLAGLGAYQMGHVWLAKMKNSEAKSKLLHAGELQVKGRRCLVIDPYRRDIKVKLHWVTFDVPVDTVRRAFEPYGEVKDVVREVWKLDGLVGVESTTLTVTLTLRQDVSLEKLPHQLRFFGGSVLVVVPGRSPICLRCRRTGHIRRDCRAPWCSECRGFGHEKRDCVKTYARVTGSDTGPETSELIMDEDETERAAAPVTPPVQLEPSQATIDNGILSKALPEAPPGQPSLKTTPEQTQDAIPKTVKSTPSDPEGTDKHRDPAVSKQDEVPTSMEVDATATKRRLDDTVSVSGEHLPRRFEREWHGEKGKIGRYKAQPVSPTRQHKPTK